MLLQRFIDEDIYDPFWKVSHILVDNELLVQLMKASPKLGTMRTSFHHWFSLLQSRQVLVFLKGGYNYKICLTHHL
jgi:hypothetical protein